MSNPLHNPASTPNQSAKAVQWVAAAACLIFFSLALFFTWDAVQSLRALWRQSARLIQQPDVKDRARQAYEWTKEQRALLQEKQESARTALYHLQNDLALKRSELVRSSEAAQKARAEQAAFEKEAKEKGLIKGSDGRWTPAPTWKQWFDSWWQSIEKVNQRWATIKQGTDTADRLLTDVKAKMDDLIILVAKQEKSIDQLQAELKELASPDEFEKRFQEEWDRQALSKVIKDAQIDRQASRVGFRVMALLHFSTGILALVLALRSLARLLQLRGKCEERSLLHTMGPLKPWGKVEHHAD